MLSSLRYRLLRIFDDIWVPISAYAILGVVTAVLAVLLRNVIPAEFAFQVGADSIDGLLNILSSSMLAVTTFSLSIMLSAFAAASNTATPRAFLLLKTDRTAQQVLASFIGAFIFSLVGIISLKIGIYGEGGRVLLFGATILVLTLIVVNLVRWIGHLTDFGRLGDTLERVEVAASNALKLRLENPWLGARPLRGPVPHDSVEISALTVGHVQFVNLEALSTITQEEDCQIFVHGLPGSFIQRVDPLANIDGLADDADHADIADRVRACFDIGMNRSFDQDPRFGMITLSEVASRALSPAVNDPGTAIDVVRRITRVLSLWRQTSETDVTYPRLWIRGLDMDDMLRDGFAAIARDGAAIYEVQIALQQGLLGLVTLAPDIFGSGAAKQAQRAILYTDGALLIESEKERLRSVARQIVAKSEPEMRGTLVKKT